MNTETILEWFSQCAFPSNVPIDFCLGTYCYHAECFTYGFVLAVFLIIIFIAQWRGLW